MNNVLRWIAGGLGLLIFGVTPFLWFVNPNLLWITCPLVIVWAVWLMLEYLRWARTLGKK